MFGIFVKGFVLNAMTEITRKSNIRKCIDQVQKLGKNLTNFDVEKLVKGDESEILKVLEHMKLIADQQ